MKLFSREYGTGFPLLIIHGLLGSSGNWHSLSRSVFADSFHTFTLDMRNHGQSPHDSEMSYELMANDVVTFADDHQLERFHVLGHSMGGKVAMTLAAREPDRVKKLIVADIAPRSYPDHHSHLFRALMSLDLADIISRRDADARLMEDIASLPVRQFLLKNLAYGKDDGYVWRPNLDNIYHAYSEISGSADQIEGGFGGETLFISGGASGYITADDNERIRKLFPKATVATMDGVGHWLHAEAPQEFSQIVLDFLAE